MTSPDKKTNNSQKGVTLLMTLMIMASLTAIVFSMTAITLNELSNSNAEINSEPAITGAESGTEGGLYLMIREPGTISCGDSNFSFDEPNNTNVSVVPTLYYSGPQSFNVQPNTEEDLFLYNPCTSGASPGYTKILVSAAPGNTSSTFNVCSWTSTTCSTTGDVYGTSFTSSASYNSLNPDTQYQIVIKNTSSTVAEDYTVQTTSNDPSVITGLPASQIVISSTGENNGVTRTVQTTLPQ